METFGPQSPESDIQKTPTPKQNLGAEKVVGDSLKIARPLTDTEHIKKQQRPEEITTVETPLYVASFSSIAPHRNHFNRKTTSYTRKQTLP